MFEQLQKFMGDRVDFKFNYLTIVNGVDQFQISYKDADYILDNTGLFVVVYGKTVHLRKVARLPKFAQSIAWALISTQEQ